MANVNGAFGLRPINTIGGEFIGSLTTCFIPATDAVAVGVGDAVKTAGGADAEGRGTVAKVAAGNTIYGVIVGFIPDYSDLTVNYRLASTARYCMVYINPNGRFIIQEDSVGGALTAADIGLNANLVVGVVDPITGLSKMQIDTSTKATTATLPLKIEGIDIRGDNEFGANADIIVTINNHKLKGGTGTVGA